MASLTPEEIRTYCKDDPTLNHLLENTVQSSDDLILLCIGFAIDDFNTIGYRTNYNPDTFPSKSCLLYGVLYHLAHGEAERHLRNQVNYNAQGVNAGLDDKFPQYSQLAQYYYQQFNQKTIQVKKAINIASAWGEELSPYSALPESQYRS